MTLRLIAADRAETLPDAVRPDLYGFPVDLRHWARFGPLAVVLLRGLG